MTEHTEPTSAGTTLADELARIAREVRAIFMDASLRPAFGAEGMETAVLAYPRAGGKALRPTLTALACRALGGAEAPALRVGAAIELYHTYTLVHDDIIDRDDMRRGHPSVHALMSEHGRADFALSADEAAHYGLSVAILTGDIQQAWAIDLLASLPDLGVDPCLTLQLIRRLEGITGPAILEGELRDIQLPFLPIAQVSSEDILHVIRTKTSALFAYAAWAGALLARGQQDEQVRALASFAEKAGMAFQLQDDVLGLVGDTEKLGKPVGNDLREGKRTLILALAWQRASDAEQEQLARVIGNPAAAAADIAAATALIQNLGAIDEVQTLADGHLASATAHLTALPPSPELALLRDMAAMMVRRNT